MRSVSLSVMWQCCAKLAERIKVLFRVETLANPRHIVLDRHTTARGPVCGKNFALCKLEEDCCLHSMQHSLIHFDLLLTKQTSCCWAARLSFFRSKSWWRLSFSISAHSITCRSCSISSLVRSTSLDSRSNCRSVRARALSVSSWPASFRSRWCSESIYSLCSRVPVRCFSMLTYSESRSSCVYKIHTETRLASSWSTEVHRHVNFQFSF